MYQGNIDILEKNGLAYLIDEIGYIAATSVANQLRGGNAVVNTSDSKSVSVSDQTLINLASVNKATVTNGDLINLANINKAIVKNGNLENYGYIGNATVSNGDVTNSGYIDTATVSNSKVVNNGFIGVLNVTFKSSATIINNGAVLNLLNGAGSKLNVVNNAYIQNINNKGWPINVFGKGVVGGYTYSGKIPIGFVDPSSTSLLNINEALKNPDAPINILISAIKEGFQRRQQILSTQMIYAMQPPFSIVEGVAQPTPEEVAAMREWADIGSSLMLSYMYGKMIESTIYSGTKVNSLLNYTKYATQATRNATSNEVVIGKYINGSNDSYEAIAESRGATYFQVDNWSMLEGKLGAKNMWSINEAFIQQQVSAGKNIYLSSNPNNANGYFYVK